jgi:hypothetical protein
MTDALVRAAWPTPLAQHAAPGRCGGQKNGGACGTAKFREETSKKADSAARGRIAAVHNVGDRIVRLQAIFAVQHSRKLDMEATPLVAIPLTQPASLGNDVRTPPPRRGVVVVVVGVRSAGRLRRAEDSCPAERNSRLHCPPHPADAVIDIAPCPNTRHRSVQRHPRLPEQRVGFPLQRADHRPDTVPGYQPAPRAGLPHAAGTLQDVGEVLRTPDRHHASEFGEFDRADAGGQGRRRAHG